MNENNKILLATNEDYLLIDKLINTYNLNHELETFDTDLINIIIECDNSLLSKEEQILLDELRIIAVDIKKNNFNY